MRPRFLLPCLLAGLAALSSPGSAKDGAGDGGSSEIKSEQQADDKLTDLKKTFAGKKGSADTASEKGALEKKMADPIKQLDDPGGEGSDISAVFKDAKKSGLITNSQIEALGVSDGAMGSARSRTAQYTPPPEQVQEQAQRQSRAVTRARAMGETLRNAFNPEEAPGGGLSSPMRPGTQGDVSTAAGAAPGSVPSPSSPKNKSDLLLASISGYGGSFKALGMRVERGPDGNSAILNRAGQPASNAELATLGAQIQSEPKALMRRPDFYDVIPREHFVELKEDYKTRPALRETAFKDIELSQEQRDFLRSESCQKMSGTCNASTVEMSYRKGETVAPEDLSLIYSRIKPAGGSADSDELGLGEFSKDDDANAEAARRKNEFARRMLSGGRFNLEGLRDRLRGFFGLAGSDSSTGEGAAAGEPGTRGSQYAAERRWGPRPALTLNAGTQRAKGALPPAPARSPDDTTTRWVWILLAAAAAASAEAARRLRS